MFNLLSEWRQRQRTANIINNKLKMKIQCINSNFINNRDSLSLVNLSLFWCAGFVQ